MQNEMVYIILKDNNIDIFKNLDDAYNYIIKQIKKEGYNCGIKYKNEIYDEQSLPENWKENLIQDKEIINIGYYDFIKDPYYFEEHYSIIMKILN